MGGTLIHASLGGGTFGWDINSCESWRWDILGGTLIRDINSVGGTFADIFVLGGGLRCVKIANVPRTLIMKDPLPSSSP